MAWYGADMQIAKGDLADTIRRNVAITDAGCWEWTGTPTTSGRGLVTIADGRSRKITTPYRAAYLAFVGPVPDGLELDHVCRNPICCNPKHLQPVKHAENLSRSPVAPATINAAKTHCLRGHEFTPENTYTNRGKRYCRSCQQARLAQRR